MKHLRTILARLPLPMLALAASYGVYSFAVLFVPVWVAVVQAAAFELTYIGLAVTEGLDDRGRRRATRISVGAVVVSILYNTLAGLFHRNPEWLTAWGGAWEWGLAVLHGAPLAWVAYLVADLLLHTEADKRAADRQWLAQELHAPAWAGPVLVATHAREVPPQATYPAPVEVHEPMPADAAPTCINAASMVCPKCGAELDPARWRAARRWGHCKNCKEAR